MDKPPARFKKSTKISSLIVNNIVLAGIMALFTGTVIWLIWPFALPAAFPGLVASGLIAAKLTWWQSVCLSWLFLLLFAIIINREKA